LALVEVVQLLAFLEVQTVIILYFLQSLLQEVAVEGQMMVARAQDQVLTGVAVVARLMQVLLVVQAIHQVYLLHRATTEVHHRDLGLSMGQAAGVAQVLLVLTELVLLEAMVATVLHLQFQAHLQRMAVEAAGDFISVVQQELAEQVEAAMAAMPDQEAVLQSIPAVAVEAVGKKSIMAETVALVL